MDLMNNARRGARARLALSSSVLALAVAALAGAAYAADTDATDANKPGSAGATAGGSSVQTLIVTAEANRVTSQAPTKASLDQMQPQSIITSKFIQQLTPETGGWTTV